MKEFFKKKSTIITIKILLSLIALGATLYAGLLGFLMIGMNGYPVVLAIGSFAIIPLLATPLIWFKKKKKWFLISLAIVLVWTGALGVSVGLRKYDQSLVVDTAPNINIEEYLPFLEDSKIIRLDNASLKLTEDLPIIDGAAAVFPVYSSFVYSVYPENTPLQTHYYYPNEDTEKFVSDNSPFQYNNTSEGYKLLGEKATDIFFGAYPSKEQIATAESKGTLFEYTQIGTEAFVFFVHKDNPVDSLTAQQIKDIYSGKITNWKEVGGKNEKIIAYQRNEGSGSQSMLIRFMGDTPIMEAPTEQVNDMMSGIIDRVADYRSSTASIGFSFRYYVEGIIQNPDIKMISIDGAAPNVENIKNGSYPITTPLYAVTYKDNPNPNVQALLDWVLSPEGQKIIEDTGYVGIQNHENASTQN